MRIELSLAMFHILLTNCYLFAYKVSPFAVIFDLLRVGLHFLDEIMDMLKGVLYAQTSNIKWRLFNRGQYPCLILLN